MLLPNKNIILSVSAKVFRRSKCTELFQPKLTCKTASVRAASTRICVLCTQYTVICNKVSVGISGGASYRQSRAYALPFSFGPYLRPYHSARKPKK